LIILIQIINFYSELTKGSSSSTASTKAASRYFIASISAWLSRKTPLNGACYLPSNIRIQLFKHSVILTIPAPRRILLGAIVCLALENTRSGLADIGDIVKIMIAMRVRFG
jgi:hypothetical protein